MNCYQTPTPRAALGIAALAMTTITIGLLVVLPAKMNPSIHEVRPLAAVKAVTSAATEVVIIPAQIDALGVRDPELAWPQVNKIQPKLKQRG